MKPKFSSIDCMPDKPQAAPADWNRIAERFKQYVLDPANRVMFVNGSGHTHFAAFHDGTGEELITLGGVVLGGIFQGEDVRRFLLSIGDFYHPEHRLFLNAPQADRVEYWYLMFVNALAASIIRHQATEAPQLAPLLKDSMDGLIRLGHRIQYDFNDQGFDFLAGAPFTNKDMYRQPDSIGGYAYLMVFAYGLYREEQYLAEARTAMERYLAFKENPWYEIPNGAMACLAAVRLNQLGGTYDIRKAVSYVFDPHHGPLHLGKWGESEVNGLMRGWRGNLDESERKIAYSLETLVLLPYLLPVLKSEPGLAAAVGKYALNVACNASWFIPDYMPEEAQSTPQFSPDVPYENLVDASGGQSPYASGDFHGHRSVYGGAITLWWDAILERTDDPYILLWDLDRTDFLNRDESGTLYKMAYNPYPEARRIMLDLGGNTQTGVDLCTNTTIFERGTGRQRITLPPNEAVVLKMTAHPIKTCEVLLREYETSSKTASDPVKLAFRPAGDRDVYNITAPFEDEGERVIAGRVESRESEHSQIVFFVERNGVWTPCQGSPVLTLQDPFYTRIRGELILGGVQIYPHPERDGALAWRTVFYKGDRIANLKLFFTGPDGMKDLRLVELQDGSVGVFTRPQGEKGGRGKIGFVRIGSLDDLSLRVVEDAPLLAGQFVDEEWGGANEVHLLSGGLIGVLGHIACYDDRGDRHYYPIVFALDPETGRYSDIELIAVRKRFLPGEAKRSDLADVVFSGGLIRKADGTADLYAGISDAEAHRMTIADPFIRFESGGV